MKSFYLQRNYDVSGISGTGRVAEVVQLSDGRVAMTWLPVVSSGSILDSIEDIKNIHGHHGNSVLVPDESKTKLYDLIHNSLVVAEIAEFTNGWCVLHWAAPPHRIEWFASMLDLRRIYVRSPHAKINARTN